MGKYNLQIVLTKNTQQLCIYNKLTAKITSPLTITRC